MKHWRTKLPLVVGAIYIIAAIPFILGIWKPSMHEGLYPGLFTLLNLPAILILRAPLEWLEKVFFPGATLHTSNLLSLVGFFAFWLLLAFAVGYLIDWRHRKIGSADERQATKSA
jgi:asparagine N-glycosylation enzyme membrane subunit Stt3